MRNINCSHVVTCEGGVGGGGVGSDGSASIQ